MKDEHYDVIAVSQGFATFRELLLDKYHKKKLSIETIALELGVHRTTIKRLMDQYDIVVRNRESLTISKAEAANLTVGEIARRYHVTHSTAWRAKRRAQDFG